MSERGSDSWFFHSIELDELGNTFMRLIKRKFVQAVLPERERLLLSQFRGFGPYYPCNDETKSIFIHIPKVAGKSIVRAVYKRDFIGHYTWREYKLISKSKYDSYFKFAFVRNPFDRIVSCYAYLKNGGNQKDDLEFMKKHKACFTSFNGFVSAVFHAENGFDWIHLKPQSNFVASSGRIIVDYIGRYESISHDFTILCGKLNLEDNLSRRNSSNRFSDYRKYYDSSTFDMVAKLYDEDFSLFGYNNREP